MSFHPSPFSLINLCSLFLQREGAEDILDFWLDVQQHENLCRAYFKDVRKSGRSIREDWPQYWDYARRRGSIYGTVVGLHPDTKRSTASTAAGDFPSDQDRKNLAAVGDADHPSPRSPSPRLLLTPENPSRSSARPTLFPLRRASRAPTIIPRSAAITRLDLVSSAERIFYRYLSPAVDPNTSHEIYLPPALRIHTFPLNGQDEPKTQLELSMLAQIPDMFHAQKEYCFRAMEQDAFPRFLRSKAFGNLTPISALVRLILGLIILWIGLAMGFSLIFLDVHPKSKRFFVSRLSFISRCHHSSLLPRQLFIPFTFAILFLISHQYELDPLLVFFGQSESTPFRTLTIREPYVRNLLLGRAVWVSIVVAILVTVLTLIFWAVPGHRL